MMRLGVFSLVVLGLPTASALPKRFRTVPAVAAASEVASLPNEMALIWSSNTGAASVFAEDHMEQRRIDDCHRDKDGRIAKRLGKTMISTLRRTYPGFAPNEQGTAKLIHVLERLDQTSLSKLIAGEEWGGAGVVV